MSKPTTKSLAKDMRKVKNILGGLKKEVMEVVIAPQQVPIVASTGHVDYCPAIGSGVDEGDRVGNEIKILSVRWRGSVFRNANDTTLGTDVRIMLFYDLDSNTSANKPLFSTVFDQITPNAFVNPAYKNRFKIVYDKRFSLMKETAGGPTRQNFDTKLIKLGGYKQTYQGAAGTSYQGRSLHWAVICDAASSAVYAASLTSRMKIYYVE